MVNNLANEIDLDAFSKFSPAISNCSELTYLSVENIMLEADGVKTFADSLLKLNKLKTLIIRRI